MRVLHRLARLSGIVLVGVGAAFGLASLGCGPDEPSRPDVEAGFWDDGRAETAMVVALRVDGSTGDASPIAEGEDLSIEHGPQGGSHVEVTVELAGVVTTSTRIGARLERADGSVVAETFVREVWSEPVDGVVRQPLFVIVFEDASGPLLLRIRARDGAGAQGTTELGVVVR